MKSLLKNSLLTLGILAGLTATLVVLAFLQYKWTGGVSEAYRGRMGREIAAAGNRFRIEFYYELAYVCMVFGEEPGESAFTSGGITASQFVQRYESWALSSIHPRLIADLFVWEVRSNRLANLVRMDPVSRRFVPVDRLTSPLEGLRNRFPDLLQNSGGPIPENDPHIWTLERDIPALVHPLVEPRSGRSYEPYPALRLSGYLVVLLDMESIQKDIFPDLVQRSFGGGRGLNYGIGVVSQGDPPALLYSSIPSWPVQQFRRGDLAVDLIGGPMEADSASPARQDSHDADERAIGRPPSVEPGGETRAGLARWRSRRPPAVIIPSRQAPAWQLVVKHKAGSLDAAVASIRSRNLVISFGILALLAASTVMVFVSTERARRMADLQIQFVAGISHELRTPLAVISAAADNLNAGIVDSKDLIRKYGYLIHSQCMRLGNMIQHVLLFASTQTERRNNASARPINVAEVAQKALAAVAYMIESAHATAETHVPTDLPQIFADPEALSHCLQNLLSNAVKYGGEERWVSLRAGLNGGGQKPEVMITVEDHGLGMDPSELDHIFEPFYRGKAAAGGQIHGTGLGLAITKSLVEEMGGSLSVASVRGQGSVFTLHLPLASSVMVLAPGPVVDQGTSVPSGDSA